ncbi:hypothetical protein [Mycobacterium paraterrae]|uniref:DUF222 domain-containing protein n=1 Tax=Mycobacterium paraterrae TaxID=577492 RepID=A0ABY3VKU1_9MYCO|nr:hypothetical protein [Mycobacterium paraterrae]UMB70034.1 hypothetical protein MKK62_01355 [Mycobacterium paraterrae]
MATLEDIAKKTAAERSAEEKAAVELLRLAHEHKGCPTGPDGLLRVIDGTAGVAIPMLLIAPLQLGDPLIAEQLISRDAIVSRAADPLIHRAPREKCCRDHTW